MKRKRQGVNLNFPSSPGWYRFVFNKQEELRYFNGLLWTGQTRESPFWLEGPEWSEVFQAKVELDSDDPLKVSRCVTTLTRKTRYAKIPRQRKGSKVHYLITVIFTAVAIGMIATTYVLQIASVKQNAKNLISANQVLASDRLKRSISSVCQEYAPSQISVIDTLSATSLDARQTQAGITRFSGEVANVLIGLDTVQTTEQDKTAFSSLQSALTKAETASQALLRSITHHQPTTPTLATLKLAVQQLETFASINSLKSCGLFLTSNKT